MKQRSISVGLDIGTTKTATIIGRENEYGKLDILGLGVAKSKGVHRGVVSNQVQTIQSIKKAVEQSERLSGHTIKDITVGIAGQHIRSLQHNDYVTISNSEGVIRAEDVNRLKAQAYKLKMRAGEEIIHALPQDYTIDDQTEIKDPVGMYGNRLEANFHIVAGQISSIRNIAICVQKAGLNLKAITLEPLASADSVLMKEEKEAGVTLVDIGGGTTDLAIFKGGILRHTAVIPYGGDIITKAIEEGCSLINATAEELKIKYGSAWPGMIGSNEIVSVRGLKGRPRKEISLRFLSGMIYATVEKIFKIVDNEIKNYGSSNQNRKLIAGIVLTGGGSQLKHLKQLVEYICGIDVRIGRPTEHLAGDSDEATCSPKFATGIGLAMNPFMDVQDEKESVEKKECIPKEEEKEKRIEEKDFSRKRLWEKLMDGTRRFLERVE
ncbi:cell division protein FtsA [Elysia marginata]|uniref:Cell division protein FtsA n=1 Tax=Elysia marginata TaxID=1093978 RepID=A0AAV4F1M3_9GAST|nr:cell division protein FtsA [Elysia marginata]